MSSHTDTSQLKCLGVAVFVRYRQPATFTVVDRWRQAFYTARMARNPHHPTSFNDQGQQDEAVSVQTAHPADHRKRILPDAEVDASGLGSRITAAREHQKITQGELAKRLNRSRVTVNQYESGGIDPPMKMVCKLAEVLAVDPAYLAFGELVSPSSNGERLHTLKGVANGDEYIELSPRLLDKAGLTHQDGQLLELTSDAVTFGMRRGDFVFLDTSADVLHGDGNLYVVRVGAGSFAVVKSDIQLVGQAQHVSLTFGHGQVLEVNSLQVEVVGVIKASLRFE